MYHLIPLEGYFMSCQQCMIHAVHSNPPCYWSPPYADHQGHMSLGWGLIFDINGEFAIREKWERGIQM